MSMWPRCSTERSVRSQSCPCQIYVEDMSANGTWINHDIKLVRGHRRLLHSGDEIALLNPYKHLKKGPTRTPGKDGEDAAKLEADAATFTFINLNR